MSNKHAWPMDVKKIRVKLVDGSVINGKINLRSEYAEDTADSYSHDYSADSGLFYKRLSDLFSRGKNPFIVIFDATVQGSDVTGVIIVNKRQILWVTPEN